MNSHRLSTNSPDNNVTANLCSRFIVTVNQKIKRNKKKPEPKKRKKSLKIIFIIMVQKEEKNRQILFRL